jgi:hypothetical protein
MFNSNIYTYISYFFLLKYLFYFYKIFNLDVSELKSILDNSKKPVIVAVYGHTYFFDVLYGLSSFFQIDNFKGLAKKKYKYLYPFFLWKYIHFIESSTTKLKLNNHLALMIEGTRSKKEKLHTGFIHLAKNNEADICYVCVNLRTNKVLCSDIVKYETIKNCENFNILLEPLKELVFNKENKIAVYPEYLSSINF